MGKKICAALLVLLLAMMATGCEQYEADYNAENNVEVTKNACGGTSDAAQVHTFNDYTVSGYQIVKNEDGSYTVTITVDRQRVSDN